MSETNLDDYRTAYTVTIDASPLLHKDPFDRLLIAQALIERNRHDRVHFVFKENGVAHDHRILARLLARRKGGPRREPHEWGHARTIDVDGGWTVQ